MFEVRSSSLSSDGATVCAVNWGGILQKEIFLPCCPDGCESLLSIEVSWWGPIRSGTIIFSYLSPAKQNSNPFVVNRFESRRTEENTRRSA